MTEHKSTTPSELIDAISEITDALVDAHADINTVLNRITVISARLLSGAASGIMIADPRGGLAVVAASDERARLIEVLQSQNESGPCPECIRRGEVIAISNLDTEAADWPQFASIATEIGYRAILAVPMILDGTAVGGLNILFTEPTAFDHQQRRRAAVLANLALLELTHEKGAHRAGRLAERTLTLLNERVHLGQATGIVAAILDITPTHARSLIDEHAHHAGLTPRELARYLTDGSMHPRELISDNQTT